MPKSTRFETKHLGERGQVILDARHREQLEPIERFEV